MTIMAPVETIPPVVRQSVPYAKWSDCYDAARSAKGLWVPIQLSDRVQARNLAFVAKKQQGMQAETRGTVTFLRVDVSAGLAVVANDTTVVRTDAAIARRERVR